MRGVFLGPPGAGKGTQAKVFCERRNMLHVSTGELLRAEVKAKTPLGEKAESIMARGDLVPDQLVLEITAKRLSTAIGGTAARRGTSTRLSSPWN